MPSQCLQFSREMEVGFLAKVGGKHNVYVFRRKYINKYEVTSSIKCLTGFSEFSILPDNETVISKSL